MYIRRGGFLKVFPKIPSSNPPRYLMILTLKS